MAPKITTPLSAETLRRMTSPKAPALCPEMMFAAVPPLLSFDQFRAKHAADLGAVVPYWAVAWPGGQALARWILDHPNEIEDRTVVDLGCGAGLAATAAMMAGAKHAVAVDTDANALRSAHETARLNGVRVETVLTDIRNFEPEPEAVLCAGDLWYERDFSRLATSALRFLANAGYRVICADPGRPNRPRKCTTECARYDVVVPESFEIKSPVECTVFELDHHPFLERMPRMTETPHSGPSDHRIMGTKNLTGLSPNNERLAEGGTTK